LLSTRTTPIEVVRHRNILRTRTNADEVHKHKIKGKFCCKAQEQRQMRLLTTRTSVNDVAKNKNNGKRC
jgi:hypothetical protein